MQLLPYERLAGVGPCLIAWPHSQGLVGWFDDFPIGILVRLAEGGRLLIGEGGRLLIGELAGAGCAEEEISLTTDSHSECYTTHCCQINNFVLSTTLCDILRPFSIACLLQIKTPLSCTCISL